MYKTCFIILILIGLFIFHKTAYSQNDRIHLEVTPYFELKNFDWNEKQENGESFVQENGYLYAIGISHALYFLKNREASLTAGANYWFGKSDYDGLLLEPGGVRTPYQTQTAYSGFEGMLHAGYHAFVSRKTSIRPFFGFKFEYWQRNLDDGGSFGYTENYKAFFGDAGIKVSHSLSEHTKLFGSGMISKPFTASLSIPTVYQEGFETNEINLTLPNNLSYKISAGISLHRFLVEFYYETWNLGKSTTDFGFFLPDATRSQKGFKIGYRIDITS